MRQKQAFEKMAKQAQEQAYNESQQFIDRHPEIYDRHYDHHYYRHYDGFEESENYTPRLDWGEDDYYNPKVKQDPSLSKQQPGAPQKTPVQVIDEKKPQAASKAPEAQPMTQPVTQIKPFDIQKPQSQPLIDTKPVQQKEPEFKPFRQTQPEPLSKPQLQQPVT